MVRCRKFTPLLDQQDNPLPCLLDRSVDLLVDLLLQLVEVAGVEFTERLFQHVAVVKLHVDLDPFE